MPVPEIPGWSLLVHALASLLIFSNDTIGGNPGLAIIIFTVLVKLATMPLTLKSLQSSRNMQAIQPLIKAAQQKHKDDKAAQQQEIMKIYSAHGVNPMLGCLPMLLQLPIFFALYQALIGLVSPQVHVDLPMIWLPAVTTAASAQTAFAQQFLWIPNLASHDPLYIMPVLAALFQFLSQRMSIPFGYSKTADPQQATMNRMMQFMPLMIIVFYSNFAAGAVLYWAASAMFQAGQQYFITGFGALAEFPGLTWLPKKELPKITPKVLARVEEEQLKESKRAAAAVEEETPAPAETARPKYRSQEQPAPTTPVVDNRPQRKGLWDRMMEQALAAQEAQQAARTAQANASAGITDGDSGTQPLPNTGVETVRLTPNPRPAGGNGGGGAADSTTLPRKKRGKR
jgi:YidC/Oxa1 family membrane protein insertase